MIESLSFSIILVDLFCMHVMRVGLDSSGFINGNGIRIAQACPISIIPWSVKASKNASIFQEIFCCFCIAEVAQGVACFTVCFHFILPSTIQMTSCPNCLSFIDCCPYQSIQQCWGTCPNQQSKNLQLCFGYFFRYF